MPAKILRPSSYQDQVADSLVEKGITADFAGWLGAALWDCGFLHREQDEDDGEGLLTERAETEIQLVVEQVLSGYADKPDAACVKLVGVAMGYFFGPRFPASGDITALAGRMLQSQVNFAKGLCRLSLADRNTHRTAAPWESPERDAEELTSEFWQAFADRVNSVPKPVTGEWMQAIADELSSDAAPEQSGEQAGTPPADDSAGEEADNGSFPQLQCPPSLLAEFAGELAKRGWLKPVDAVSLSRLTDTKEPNAAVAEVDGKDPENLYFWLRAVGPSVFDDLLPALMNTPDDVFGALARGIIVVARKYDHDDRMGTGQSYREQMSAEVLAALAPYFEHLQARAVRDLKGCDHGLRSTWWRYAWELFGFGRGERAVQPAPDLNPVLTSATEYLGRVRPMLREAHLETSGQTFQQNLESFGNAVHALKHLSGPWKAMQPMLLALRALTAPAVADDLRYWPEGRAGYARPPEPWCEIPGHFAGIAQRGMAVLQLHDRELLGPRQDFAEFCADRLRSKKGRMDKGRALGNDDMEEPHPAWRAGYVLAIDALCVSPRATGHQLMSWLAKNDPDKEVRVAAARVEQNIRHGHGLPKNMSPRQAILVAFWFLRWAHLEALKRNPDVRGAQRTRAKEKSRIKELEAIQRMRAV